MENGVWVGSAGELGVNDPWKPIHLLNQSIPTSPLGSTLFLILGEMMGVHRGQGTVGSL